MESRGHPEKEKVKDTNKYKEHPEGKSLYIQYREHEVYSTVSSKESTLLIVPSNKNKRRKKIRVISNQARAKGAYGSIHSILATQVPDHEHETILEKIPQQVVKICAPKEPDPKKPDPKISVVSLFEALKINMALEKELADRAASDDQKNNYLRMKEPAPIANMGVNPRCYLVMNDLGETDLLSLLKDRNEEKEGALLSDFSFASQFVIALCQNVQRIHASQIIHADLKPENIMVKNGKPYVIDFNSSGDINSKSTGGSPTYMSPEMLEARNNFSPIKLQPFVDYFSLAIILAEILLGEDNSNKTVTAKIKAKRKVDFVTLEHMLEFQAERDFSEGSNPFKFDYGTYEYLRNCLLELTENKCTPEAVIAAIRHVEKTEKEKNEICKNYLAELVLFINHNFWPMSQGKYSMSYLKDALEANSKINDKDSGAIHQLKALKGAATEQSAQIANLKFKGSFRDGLRGMYKAGLHLFDSSQELEKEACSTKSLQRFLWLIEGLDINESSKEYWENEYKNLIYFISSRDHINVDYYPFYDIASAMKLLRDTTKEERKLVVEKLFEVKNLKFKRF